MEFTAVGGWERDSDTLYLHESGVRIECRVYREKEGWFLIPADLDQAVLGFAPDREGLEQAFGAFEKEVLRLKHSSLSKGGRKSEESEAGDEDSKNSPEDDEADDGDL